jgi:hypothetical protein
MAFLVIVLVSSSDYQKMCAPNKSLFCMEKQRNWIVHPT